MKNLAFIEKSTIENLVKATKSIQTNSDLEMQDMPVLASHLVAAQSALAARMAEMHSASDSHGWGDDDRFLGMEEATQRLGVKDHYIYHHSKSLPFIVHLGRKLKFSEKGIEKFIKEQRQISEGV